MQQHKERISMDDMLNAMAADHAELVQGVEADRFWLWYCGAKPEQTVRDWFYHHGWRESKAARNGGGHMMPSGALGTWYFWDKVPPRYNSRFNKEQQRQGERQQQQPQKPQQSTPRGMRPDFMSPPVLPQDRQPEPSDNEIAELMEKYA